MMNDAMEDAGIQEFKSILYEDEMDEEEDLVSFEGPRRVYKLTKFKKTDFESFSDV